VFQVSARTDVHVQPRNAKALALGSKQAITQLLMPDAVFGLLATGIRLLAVTVAKTWIEPQRDMASRVGGYSQPSGNRPAFRSRSVSSRQKATESSQLTYVAGKPSPFAAKSLFLQGSDPITRVHSD